MVSEYPRVRIAGAPGFEDFEGNLIHEGVFTDGSKAVVIDDGKEIFVFDMKYIEREPSRSCPSVPAEPHGVEEV